MRYGTRQCSARTVSVWSHAASQQQLAAVVEEARTQELLSGAFTLDGNTDPGLGIGAELQGEEKSAASWLWHGNAGELCCATSMNRAPIQMRGCIKRAFGQAVPSYLGHAITENRNGLIVTAEASRSSNAAEREVALTMLTAWLDRNGSAGKKITLAPMHRIRKSSLSRFTRAQVAPHIHEYVR